MQAPVQENVMAPDFRGLLLITGRLNASFPTLFGCQPRFRLDVQNKFTTQDLVGMPCHALGKREIIAFRDVPRTLLPLDRRDWYLYSELLRGARSASAAARRKPNAIRHTFLRQGRGLIWAYLKVIVRAILNKHNSRQWRRVVEEWEGMCAHEGHDPLPSSTATDPGTGISPSPGS